MASSFFRTRDRMESELEERVAQLTREVASLRKSATKRGARAYSDASDTVSDVYEEVWDRIVDMLPDLRRGARRAGKSVQDHQTLAAVAGIIIVGGIAALLLRR